MGDLEIAHNNLLDDGTLKMGSGSSQEELLSHEPAPTDRFELVWWIFVLLGTGILLPWNAFITAFDYWDKVYPDYETEYVLSVLYQIPNMAVSMYMMLRGDRYSLTKRIMWSIWGNLALMVLTTVTVAESANLTTETSAIVVFASAFGCGVVAGVMQGSVFSLSAFFPPKYTGAVMSGNGIAGLTVSVLRLITKGALPATSAGSRHSALVYFVVACLIVALGIVGFATLYKNDFARYHMSKYAIVGSPGEDSSVDGASLLAPDTTPKTMTPRVDRRVVWRKVRSTALSVMAVFMVTLGLFPGFSVSETKSIWGMYTWFPVLMITMFNVGDTCGRTLPRWVTWVDHRKLPFFCGGRLVFVLLFALCVNPYVIKADAAVLGIMFFFAVSNGFLSTRAMIIAPQLVQPAEREVTGLIMAFCLVIGLAAGSCLSFLMLLAK